jgi:hypothetical protein
MSRPVVPRAAFARADTDYGDDSNPAGKRKNRKKGKPAGDGK